MNETGPIVRFAIDRKIFSKKVVVETIKLFRDYASFELLEEGNDYEVTATDIVKELAGNFENEFRNYMIYVYKGLSLRKKV